MVQRLQSYIPTPRPSERCAWGCPACGSPKESTRFPEGNLECAECGQSYKVRKPEENAVTRRTYSVEGAIDSIALDLKTWGPLYEVHGREVREVSYRFLASTIAHNLRATARAESVFPPEKPLDV